MAPAPDWDGTPVGTAAEAADVMLETLARQQRQPGESFEQAYVRVQDEHRELGCIAQRIAIG